MKRAYSWAIWLCLLCIGLCASPVAGVANPDYVVQPGDTLIGVAARHGVTPESLAEANGIHPAAWIYVGQRLKLPGQADALPPTAGAFYIVQPGDTLTGIAAREGLSPLTLARANGLAHSAWVYTGQRLTIPRQTVEPEPAPEEAQPSVYVVQPGNTLFSIARGHNTTVDALRAANGLTSNLIYVGQALTIPDGSTPARPSATPPPGAAADEKWIAVNLTTQRITAYQGQTPVYSALVSTGTRATPTVVGTYRIYVKYESSSMSGPGYHLPNVPHAMYFYAGYAIHGAYWHTNFGTPMSHGCVNLSLTDAAWFYNWASVGTLVVTHY